MFLLSTDFKKAVFRFLNQVDTIILLFNERNLLMSETYEQFKADLAVLTQGVAELAPALDKVHAEVAKLVEQVGPDFSQQAEAVKTALTELTTVKDKITAIDNLNPDEVAAPPVEETPEAPAPEETAPEAPAEQPTV